MERGNPSRRRREGWRTTWQRTLCVLLAMAVFAPLPAAAQQGQSYAVVRADVMDSMTVINNADMYFGVITPGTANGTVVMTPDDQSNVAACAVNNGITRSGACRAARFEGDIPFIHNLQITKPAGDQIMLTGPAGATMRVRRFMIAAGSPWMLGTDFATAQTVTYLVFGGTFVIYVGGTLDVARNQRAGVYNGSFTLTFNYN